MNKTLKRILAVIILIISLMLVGYSYSTFSRLSSYPTEYGCLQTTYYSNENVVLKFQVDQYLVYIVNDSAKMIRMTDYEDGIVYCTDGVEEYRFEVCGDGIIYDVQQKVFIYEGGEV